MTGCAQSIKHSQAKQRPVISPSVLEPCETLTPAEDGSFPTIAGKLVEVAGQYQTCKLKQEALAKDVKALQDYNNDNKAK